MYAWVETFIAGCFYYSGLILLARWWQQRSQPLLVILAYHLASGGDLRRHLLYLRRHYRVLHLEAALEELYISQKRGSQRKDRRTPLVLTFDDGYYDNYTHAFVLAQELQVPITIFLIPGYIESGSRFWWQEGKYLVAHAKVSKATIEERTYHLEREEERKALIQAIDVRVCHATSVSVREAYLATVRKILLPSVTTVAERHATLPLTWTEVQTMAKSEWISFGAHTMHHPILGYLIDPLEIREEVTMCRELLQQVLGHPIRSFAYPVGYSEHIGDAGLCAVREAKYNWALTAIGGFNTPQTNPFLLRRIVVDVDQHWLRIAVKTSGLWSIFTHLCQIPLTLIKIVGSCINRLK